MASIGTNPFTKKPLVVKTSWLKNRSDRYIELETGEVFDTVNARIVKDLLVALNEANNAANIVARGYQRATHAVSKLVRSFSGPADVLNESVILLDERKSVIESYENLI